MSYGTELPETTIETVTPDVARKYLGMNIKNRTKKLVKIAQFARDIQDGRWNLTMEAIKFDWHGNLIDGQNRCLAVIEADMPIVTAVARNVNPNAQDSMDAGSTRKAADQLTIHGRTGGKDLSAALNAWKSWNLGVITHANSDIPATYRLTNSEAIQFADQNPRFIETVPSANKYKRAFHMPVGALAVAYREFTIIDPEDAEEFFARFLDMDFAGRGLPIKALKRRIDRDAATDRARYRLGAAIYMLLRTWNAYRTQESLTKLQIGSSERGWAPIPRPL